jgi:ribosomal protein L13E
MLQRFLDDELAGEHRIDALVRHLDDCKRCGLEVDTYRRIKQSLEDRRSEVPPESVARLREFGERLADNS